MIIQFIKVVLVFFIIVVTLYFIKPKENKKNILPVVTKKMEIQIGYIKRLKKSLDINDSLQKISKTIDKEKITKEQNIKKKSTKKGVIKKKRVLKSTKEKKKKRSLIITKSAVGKGKFKLSFSKDSDIIELFNKDFLEIYLLSKDDILFKYLYNGNVRLLTEVNFKVRRVALKAKIFKKNKPKAIYVKLGDYLENNISDMLKNNKKISKIIINQNGKIVGKI